MEESKKTHHEPEKKKMVMKLGKAGGGTGAVVLLGVATLAAAAIASAFIIRRKGWKSGRNHHSHQEVEQSQQTEFPETLNKENDQDNSSKEREFILHNTPLSVKNNSCNGTADMDVIKDDSASFHFSSENLKVDEKPMPEINGGTGDSAYKEEEVWFSDNNNTKRLESSANTDGSVVVVNKEELHFPTSDDKFLLEPESKDETQNREVEIELNMDDDDDDDAVEGLYIDKIVAENNQEMQENIELKKNAVEMQFSEEDETKDRLDQEIIISSMPRKILKENYGEGGQELVPPVENTNSNKKESSFLIETVEKFEGNGAIETAHEDDSNQESKIHLVEQECDHPDAEIVQEYEQEISCNDDEQFHPATFDDKLLHEPESKNKMHKHEAKIELAKEDGAIDGVRIDKIMEDEDNQNMQENIEGKQNAVELQFSEEKTMNFHDQEIVGTVSSMPGTTVLEGIHNAERKDQEECDYPDAEIWDCERKISRDDDEQNAESNAECGEESLPELSVDGEGDSKMTYMVELTETHSNQPRYSSRRRILIGTLSALSWFSCTWFFGLSFVKLGFIVFLTMILSKIHGY